MAYAGRKALNWKYPVIRDIRLRRLPGLAYNP
jgi:hypothetical protein